MQLKTILRYIIIACNTNDFILTWLPKHYAISVLICMSDRALAEVVINSLSQIECLLNVYISEKNEPSKQLTPPILYPIQGTCRIPWIGKFSLLKNFMGAPTHENKMHELFLATNYVYGTFLREHFACSCLSMLTAQSPVALFLKLTMLVTPLRW